MGRERGLHGGKTQTNMSLLTFRAKPCIVTHLAHSHIFRSKRLAQAVSCPYAEPSDHVSQSRTLRRPLSLSSPPPPALMFAPRSPFLLPRCACVRARVNAKFLRRRKRRGYYSLTDEGVRERRGCYLSAKHNARGPFHKSRFLCRLARVARTRARRASNNLAAISLRRRIT